MFDSIPSDSDWQRLVESGTSGRRFRADPDAEGARGNQIRRHRANRISRGYRLGLAASLLRRGRRP
jgi:hypothetical protein